MFKKIILCLAVFCAGVTAQALPGSIGVVTDEEAKQIMCSEEASISAHMRKMGFLIRKLTGAVQSTFDGTAELINKKIVIRNTQELRVHLSAVLPLTPPKILSIDEEDPQGAKLIFQSYLVDMLKLTIQLEQELLKVPANDEAAKVQADKVDEYITAIYNTVEKAHDIFRK